MLRNKIARDICNFLTYGRHKKNVSLKDVIDGASDTINPCMSFWVLTLCCLTGIQRIQTTIIYLENLISKVLKSSNKYVTTSVVIFNTRTYYFTAAISLSWLLRSSAWSKFYPKYLHVPFFVLTIKQIVSTL